ncbi:Metal-dependent hydrolase [Methylacidimicrobium sp. AP8]|uniref:M48 family metallopeptidase n=1 Tax=Methylacidimicrobium sp. AP8 TaxID=2730359 RepID=UPI0018C114C1|nr:SprT family zinc-dependent metalloprotease [Methylacidimicrobium sp. AP8]CAB4243811.1 Metal-dependent hydrolase [Methylacidimicrobium sp. AP8]
MVLLRKRIRNLRLRVSPPDGRAILSAPCGVPLAALRAFVSSKLDWIRRKQAEVRARPPALPFSYEEGEGHELWGERYPLRVVAGSGWARVEFSAGVILLHVPPGAPRERKEALLARWYRDRVREAALALIEEWEPRLGVRVDRLFVQKMRRRWGSCNTRDRRIRLNSELAKKPFDCFEYVVVHELAHLLVPRHDRRFRAILDRFLPDWRERQRRLNA